MIYTTRIFWIGTLERALKTFAQMFLVLVGGNQIAITDLNWPQTLSMAAMAAVLSIMTSIADPIRVADGPNRTPEDYQPRHATAPKDAT